MKMQQCFKSIKIIAVVILNFWVLGNLSSQNPDSTLIIVARAYYDGSALHLRWIPVNIATWKWGNTNGYSVGRYTSNADGIEYTYQQYDSSYIELISQVKPLPESQWEVMADTIDLAGVAAGSIYGDSLDLLPPEGASLATIYQKSNELSNRFGFSLFAADQHIEVAKAMGLAVVDTSVLPNYTYQYVVKPYQPSPGFFVDSGFVIVTTDTIFPFLPPLDLSAFGGDSMALVSWNSNEQQYTSYSVERSDDNGVSFHLRNSSPIVSTIVEDETIFGTRLSFTDTLPANGIKYIYRIIGHSPFGFAGPPSDTVHVSGKPGPMETTLTIDSISEQLSGQLTVFWAFPVQNESKILGFDVYRSKNINGPFEKITATKLSVNVRSFVDIAPWSTGYYMVEITDTNSYSISSYPLLGQLTDSIPPSKPIGLTGATAATGIVTLNWPRNPENDLMGYRVYMATSEPGDYTQVTSTWMNDTTFRYQLNLNTLSEFVYFRITAVDYHHNQSEKSDPVQIQRPDIIPPAPPSINSVEATMAGVSFTWTLSNSPDAMAYEFQRKTDGKAGWTRLVAFDIQSPLLAFTDSTADKRYWYQYRLVAIDEAGNRAGSHIARAKPVNDGLRAPLQNLDVQYTPGANTFATLTWTYGKDPDLLGFQIYRGLDTLRMYSYRFFPEPLPAQSAAAIEMSVFPAGTGTQYVFYDYDLRFTEAVIGAYTYNYNPALNPNLAIPAPPATPPPGGTPVSYTPTTKNYPANGSPTRVWYWVMAKFADGTTSPLAGPVWINL